VGSRVVSQTVVGWPELVGLQVVGQMAVGWPELAGSRVAGQMSAGCPELLGQIAATNRKVLWGRPGATTTRFRLSQPLSHPPRTATACCCLVWVRTAEMPYTNGDEPLRSGLRGALIRG
jgi:hypothetical protein